MLLREVRSQMFLDLAIKPLIAGTMKSVDAIKGLSHSMASLISLLMMAFGLWLELRFLISSRFSSTHNSLLPRIQTITLLQLWVAPVHGLKKENLVDRLEVLLWASLCILLVTLLILLLLLLYLNRGFWRIGRPEYEPQSEHVKQKKERRQNCCPFIWMSAQADLSWVFWDPTGEKQQEFHARREKTYIGWLQRFFKPFPQGRIQSDEVGLAEQGGNRLRPLAHRRGTSLSWVDDSGRGHRGLTSGAMMSGALDPDILLGAATVRRRETIGRVSHIWTANSEEISRAIRTGLLTAHEELDDLHFKTRCDSFSDLLRQNARHRRGLSLPSNFFSDYTNHEMRPPPPRYCCSYSDTLIRQLGEDFESRMPFNQTIPGLPAGSNTNVEIDDGTRNISLHQRRLNSQRSRKLTHVIPERLGVNVEGSHDNLEDYEAEGSIDDAMSSRASSHLTAISLTPISPQSQPQIDHAVANHGNNINTNFSSFSAFQRVSQTPNDTTLAVPKKRALTAASKVGEQDVSSATVEPGYVSYGFGTYTRYEAFRDARKGMSALAEYKKSCHRRRGAVDEVDVSWLFHRGRSFTMPTRTQRLAPRRWTPYVRR